MSAATLSASVSKGTRLNCNCAGVSRKIEPTASYVRVCPAASRVDAPMAWSVRPFMWFPYKHPFPHDSTLCPRSTLWTRLGGHKWHCRSHQVRDIVACLSTGTRTSPWADRYSRLLGADLRYECSHRQLMPYSARGFSGSLEGSI